jgi:hypothetical protein
MHHARAVRCRCETAQHRSFVRRLSVATHRKRNNRSESILTQTRHRRRRRRCRRCRCLFAARVKRREATTRAKLEHKIARACFQRSEIESHRDEMNKSSRITKRGSTTSLKRAFQCAERWLLAVGVVVGDASMLKRERERRHDVVVRTADRARLSSDVDV